MQPNTDPDYLASQGLSRTFPQRFMAKVQIVDGHWFWTGCRSSRHGYGQIFSGFKYGKRRALYAHIGSWLLFHGPVPPGLLVLHNCPGKHVARCVNPEHLKVGTAKENTADMYAQGTAYLHKGHNHTFRGEQNFFSKLTLEQVEEIRRRYTGKMGQQNDLAAEYGVNQATIWNILSGRHWKHGSGISPGLLVRRARVEAERNRIRLPFAARGEVNPSHKLTQQQVDEIRQKYTGKRGQQSALAREYHVRQGTIWFVVNHVTW